MNTSQLKAGLVKMQFDGDVLPYDYFSKFSDNKVEAYILNTGHSSANGEHWVCFLNYPGCVEFFDSYGLSPQYYFPQLVINKPLIYNSMCIQDFESNFCGHHVLFYLDNRKNKMSSMENLLSLYNENSAKFNDKRAYDFVKSHYCSVMKFK